MRSRCRQLEKLLPMIQKSCPLTAPLKKKAKASSSTPSKPERKARSSPKTTTTSRPSSANPRTRTTERRPSKTVMCFQKTLKSRDREPKSPEQIKPGSSSSSSRRSRMSGATRRRGGCSPTPLARSRSTLEAGVLQSMTLCSKSTMARL